MTANVGELKSAPDPLPPGAPNCGWLNKLKNSARKSIRIPSLGTKCLMMEKSVFTKSGPPTGSVRGALPSSPAAGCEKQAVLNHSARVGLLSAGLQVILGRIKADPFALTKFTPVTSGLALLSMSKIGKPEVACSITVASHPPRIAFAAAFQLAPQCRPLPNGKS